ncbi:hypothetical protein [Micromonospora sp. NBS 11-29]|nr:hypothetical protein [Micromonospora sp. NBS 11-29]
MSGRSLGRLLGSLLVLAGVLVGADVINSGAQLGDVVWGAGIFR